MQADEIVRQSMLRELKQTEYFSSDLHLKPIQGGAVNNSFKLLGGKTHYFVKVFSAELPINIDRQRNFDQQHCLAKMGLAPAPIYLSEQHAFQVDQWVPHKSLLALKKGRAETYQTLAACIAFIHQVELPPTNLFEQLDLPSKLREYQSFAEASISDSFETEIVRVTDIWQQESNELRCLCHNDLSLQHVLPAPHKLVFDWEYAAISSPYFDLASSLEINQSKPEDECIFINYYAELIGKSAQEVQDKVTVMKPIVSLTNQLWYAAAKAIARI